MNHPGGGLLGAKIVPPTVPGGFLRRPRLQERSDLRRHQDHPSLGLVTRSGVPGLLGRRGGTLAPREPAGTTRRNRFTHTVTVTFYAIH